MHFQLSAYIYKGTIHTLMCLIPWTILSYWSVTPSKQ